MSSIFNKPSVVVPGTSAGLVSASGLTGNTTGSSIAAGFVGELISGSSITEGTVTGSFVTQSTISVTAGVWMLYYEIVAIYQTGTGAGDSGLFVAKMTDSTGTTLIGNSVRAIQAASPVSTTFGYVQACLRSSEIVSVSGSTTYLVQAKKIDGTGTGSGSILNDTTNGQSIFRAVRIA